LGDNIRADLVESLRSVHTHSTHTHAYTCIHTHSPHPLLHPARTDAPQVLVFTKLRKLQHFACTVFTSYKQASKCAAPKEKSTGQAEGREAEASLRHLHLSSIAGFEIELLQFIINMAGA